MCWEPKPGTQVFDSSRAEQIAVDLCFKIAEERENLPATAEPMSKPNKPMKTTVIYHRADFDGLFCREIARKFMPPETVFIGWDYGDPVPDVDTGGHEQVQLYMLDISIPELMDYPGLVWIDHHKSAMDKWHRASLRGYRIDGVAACRLAWQYLNNRGEDGRLIDLPIKQNFIDRAVVEPLAVRLAGEYDIWDKRDPDAELFQHGLRSMELTSEIWSGLLSQKVDDTLGFTTSQWWVNSLLEKGRAIQYAKTQENEGIITSYGFDVEFEGLNFLACNHARFNSHLFTAGIRPDHDALLGFNWDGKQWRVSLYHAPGKEQHDLSLIATKYGGGGHKGACGFRVANLPFLTRCPNDSNN